MAGSQRQSRRLVWLSDVSSREGGKSGGQRGSEGLATARPPRPRWDSGLYSRKTGARWEGFEQE